MLTPVVLVADYAGTIQVSDRTDVRVRATKQTGQAPGETTTSGSACHLGNTGSQSSCTTGIDLANQGAILLNADDRIWHFKLVYSPLVTLPDAEEGVNNQNGGVELLQTAAATATWHSRTTRLVLSEGASYGHFNSEYLFQPGAPSNTSSPGQVAPPPVTTPGGSPTSPSTQLAPAPTSVYFGSTATSATLSVAADRRSSVSIDGSYVVSGGLDDNSRLFLPLDYGPRADAMFGYALGRTLRTVTTAHGELTHFTATQCYASDGTPLPSTCRPDDQIAQLSQGLRDSLSRSTLLSVDGTIAYARFRTDAGAPYEAQWYPGGQASLTHRYGERGLQTVVAAVQLGPLVDVRTGLISYRTQAQVTLIDALSSIVTVSVDAAGAQTFPTDSPLAASIVRSDLEARFRADRHGRVTLILGETEQWQDQGALGGFFSIYGYFAVTLATPAVRF